ncbi:MAG TPA: hypothetical protein VKA34_09405 [Balneolales bacterium]|nr:hypothetical protein [Balneolales bacterium]
MPGVPTGKKRIQPPITLGDAGRPVWPYQAETSKEIKSIPEQSLFSLEK